MLRYVSSDDKSHPDFVDIKDKMWKDENELYSTNFKKEINRTIRQEHIDESQYDAFTGTQMLRQQVLDEVQKLKANYKVQLELVEDTKLLVQTRKEREIIKTKEKQAEHDLVVDQKHKMCFKYTEREAFYNSLSGSLDEQYDELEFFTKKFITEQNELTKELEELKTLLEKKQAKQNDD